MSRQRLLAASPQEQELVEALLACCRISSGSGEREGLYRMAEAVAQMLASQGLVCQLEERASVPVLRATVPGAQPPYLLVVGHLDTVLPAIAPRVEGGRLVGTGAVDMKGGIVALWGALGLLRRAAVPLPANLAVVLVPDEESSGEVSRQAMASFGEMAEVVLVVEPGERTERGETLVVGRKGLAEFTVECLGRAAHAGLAAAQGRSAALAAALWVVEAAQVADRFSQATVNVARVVAGDAEFVGQLATHAHLLLSAERCNVVPDLALLRGEFRFPTDQEGRKLRAALEEVSRNVEQAREVQVRFQVGQWVSPVEAQAGEGLARLAQELGETLGLSLALEPLRGGISLPNFLQRPDLPVLDGLGPVGGGMHTREEFVEIGSLVQRARLLALLFHELASKERRASLLKSSRRNARAQA
jgi:glutamate carboxypeptidase